MNINDINPSENQIDGQNKVFEEHIEKEKSKRKEEIDRFRHFTNSL